MPSAFQLKKSTYNYLKIYLLNDIVLPLKVKYTLGRYSTQAEGIVHPRKVKYTHGRYSTQAEGIVHPRKL